MNFQFYTAGQIVFGRGSFSKLKEILPQYGHRYFVALNGDIMRKNGVIQRLEEMLAGTDVTFVYFEEVLSEPTPAIVERGCALALTEKCDATLGIGGGSAIDTAKAVAGLVTNGGSIVDYLEGVGIGKKVTEDTLPFIAVPTTAGTGAEVTKNAVISSAEGKYKKSFRSEKLLAKVAVVDPELTMSVPRAVTARTGMDAITQLIESFTTRKANPMTSGLALYGLRFAPALIRAYDQPNDIDARESISLCSLLSGITLANSGLGAAHGVAAGLGALYGVPHGEACAIMLPHVMRLNLPVCTALYAEIGRTLCGKTFSDDAEAAEAAVAKIEDMCGYLGISPDLKHLFIKKEDLVALAEASMGSSMSGNPIQLSVEEWVKFLEKLI